MILERLDKFVEFFQSMHLEGQNNFQKAAHWGIFPVKNLMSVSKCKTNVSKTTKVIEGWYGALKGSLGYVHPTVFKFVEFLRRKQSEAENKLIALGMRKTRRKQLTECNSSKTTRRK